MLAIVDESMHVFTHAKTAQGNARVTQDRLLLLGKTVRQYHLAPGIPPKGPQPQSQHAFLSLSDLWQAPPKAPSLRICHQQRTRLVLSHSHQSTH
jgi:hypothetical protein